MADYAQGSFRMATPAHPLLDVDAIVYLDRDALADLQEWYRDLTKRYDAIALQARAVVEGYPPPYPPAYCEHDVDGWSESEDQSPAHDPFVDLMGPVAELQLVSEADWFASYAAQAYYEELLAAQNKNRPARPARAAAFLKLIRSVLRAIHERISTILQVVTLASVSRETFLLERSFFHLHGDGRPPTETSKWLVTGPSVVTGRMCSGPAPAHT